ncbi:MAG: insulinase family protein [Rhodocyclaceae bacterium]|nr:insulinase family protein [Rhodocyclaceae bacterium]
MKLRSSLSIFACTALLSCSAFAASVAQNAVRQSIGGIDLVVVKTGIKDVVTIRGTLAAGDARSPESNVAMADLAAGMLDKGTATRDKFAIAKALGDVGATIGFGTSASALNITAKCLRADLPMVMNLLAEQLRAPAFSADEFGKLKKQIAGQVARSLEETDYRANLAYVRAIYPKGHPNRETSTEEYLAAIDKATLAEVKAFHAQFYGPVTMRLVVVGDVDAAAVSSEVGKVFSGWAGGSAQPRGARAGKVDAVREQAVFMADKTNVTLIWGQATGLRYGEPDVLALRVGTAAFGSGFTGRLMATVRDKDGLTYGIGAFNSNDVFLDGDWRIQGNFAPEMLAKGIASTRKQLMLWHKDGISAAELADNKGKYVGAYKLGLSTTAGMAGVILNTLNEDLPLSYIDEFGDKVNALTLEQVNGAIKKHLNPEQMVMIKAGTIPAAK